jgi:hypothetical protein
MRSNFFVLALVMAVHQAAYGADNSTKSGASPEPVAETAAKHADPMKVRLRIKDTVLTATLMDRKTAQDFVSLLPMTLTMNDLFRREKYGHLPRQLSEGGNGRTVMKLASWFIGPPVPTSLSFIGMTASQYPTQASSS